MMKIELVIDGKVVYSQETDAAAAPEPVAKKIFEGFDSNRNVIEYNGIVGEIQKWYYGSLIKSAWCATSLCYFAYLAGALDLIGGKHENVYDMMVACQKAAAEGKGTFYERGRIPAKVPQYAILFWLWSGNIMTPASSKHVGMAEYSSTGQTIYCIGGNQSDKICTKAYNRDNLYAIYVLD